MKLSSSDPGLQPHEGEKRCLNSELWHACAGPLVSLPSVRSRVVYFPQGHSEQVAASTNKEVDAQIPNYPSLPPQLICQLHDVTMHVDAETDEVYAQMTLQPLSPQEQKDAFFPADLGAPSKQPTNYFCKTLTASDTSTHGGFSVPRRAAEKVFPPLDYSQQPPAQELIARDLHDNEWKFRHIFRGQPKRHLLTTGWSVFVSAKKLVAGDSVLFIWNEKNQLLLGIRRASRPQTVMPSSVLSSDSMHIGLLAAAAHAAATNSRFTIFYNPRASPTEFVIPLAKYIKAVYHTRISIGMRFRMLFETEESSVRRYMGTITGITDLDPVRWPNSHWRSVKVGWDESTAGERQPRVSLWEIEPLTTFPMYPSPFSLRLKRPWLPDLGVPSVNFPVPGITSLMQPRLDPSLLGMQPDVYQAIAAAALQDMSGLDPSRQASSSVLQFQQPQAMPSGAIPLLPSQLLQHSQLQTQSQQALLRTAEENHNQAKIQPHLFPQQMQSRKTFNEQQNDHHKLAQQLAQQQQLLSTQHQLQQQQQMTYQQQKQQEVQCLLPQSMSQQHCQQQLESKQQQLPEQLQQYLPNQHVDRPFSTLPQFTSSQSTAVFNQQDILGSVENPLATSSLSPLPGMIGSISSEMSNPLVSSTTWLPKRIGVDTAIPSGNPCLSQPVKQFGHLESVSQPPVTLAPFLKRECSVTQELDAAEQNNTLFGVHSDSSVNLDQNGITKSRNFVSRSDPTTLPFSSDFTASAESDFPFSPTIGSSSCLDGSGFIRSTENTGHVNPQKETFVKVHKSGSFGRSLDITRFNSYPELRKELGRMFGLEGQLEDHLRSGWQLVFVDQENDILLVGDDPWQEFVNSVGCIKILSPQEVQQMGNSGDVLLDALPSKGLSSNACDEYIYRQSSRNMTNGITSVGSLEC